ncbi:MAG: hypothetical protein [phage Lak_Megaphage_RVC_AP4_GC26]|uniref:Uncharacterized protein n=1 Tax=phage Lak_Megaphage_RVC_AP3_GC26 TaxID=3109225 RepID=A0ABZ0YZS9_9CAUD|nr:MAG: hypothetical protein [phage Lak_Megaphage_RVC_AP3_GC26]WQJ52246.1 MAG: hypothetical protein [phage Lak_Megaphage_RVC_AP4_GC26]
MVNYDDLKNLYKQFSDLCKTEGTERYPKILLDIFGSYNCNILTNIPDYYLDYNITLGDYIYDQAGHSCLDIFYPLNDFFDDIIDDSSKNNKTYDLSTLQLTLSCCISEFMSTCDELNDKLPYIFCCDITDTKISEISQCAIQFRNAVLNIFADYVDIKKLIIRHLNQKLDKKKKQINNILETVNEYQDECTLIEKQIKEYEDMV